MNAFYFTDDLRIVLAGARDEARRMRHEYVGAEHIVLSYASGSAPSASRLLEAVSADAAEVRATIEGILHPGITDHASDAYLPYTSRAKHSLEHAMTIARELGHNVVGIEHMLAGVLREQKGIAAQVLAQRGVTEDAVKAALLNAHPHGPARAMRKRSLLGRIRRLLRRR